ncbi:hypothetical protein AGMMS49983_17330 [Clostridia bacterium]|nr:hypothetical protein AGMMS49983_17330 [Clostridia bacterium]
MIIFDMTMTQKKIIVVLVIAIGAFCALGLRYYNGYWFFFDFPDRSGWVSADEGRRYLDRHAGAVKSALLEIDSEKYYFDADGAVYTGEITLDGYVYSFDDETGVMRYGWTEKGDDRFYFDTDGHKIMNREYQIDGQDYLFGEDGAEFVGAVNLGGKDYYYEEITGKLKDGEKQVDGAWYYYGMDGARFDTGWVTLAEGRTAYYDGAAGMLFGEQTIDGQPYLLNISTGGRLTGTVYFDGAVFTISGDGVVQDKRRIPVWKGIDVSVHQEESVDWAAVAESGVQFAIVRAGYLAAEDRPIFALDRLYAYNVLEAQKNGISVGAYLYLYNFTEEGIREGLDDFHAYTAEHRIKLDLPVFLDVENEEYFRVGSEELGGYDYRTSLVRNSMEYLRELGYEPGFYTFVAWAGKQFDAERLWREGYSFWLARWYNNNADLDPATNAWNDEDHPSLWQFRATGQFPGIRKEVDVNYLYWDRMP